MFSINLPHATSSLVSWHSMFAPTEYLLVEGNDVCQQCSLNTARKTIFSFSGSPEKMIFPKKPRWNMIFLALSKKMIILFPENMILLLGRKMKDDLSKKTAPEHDLSCIIWKDGICFPGNIIFFLWMENERWSFSRNTQEHDISCVYEQALQTWC